MWQNVLLLTAVLFHNKLNRCYNRCHKQNASDHHRCKGSLCTT